MYPWMCSYVDVDSPQVLPYADVPCALIHPVLGKVVSNL